MHMLKEQELEGASQYTVQSWPHDVGAGQSIAKNDYLAVETPVALVFNGISHVVMMATPKDLEDFALGFGLTEGLFESPKDLYGVEQIIRPEGVELVLEVSSACEWRLKERRRTLAGRTGCGLCGTDSLEQVRRPLSAVDSVSISGDAIIKAEQALRQWQTLQQLTGATHAAAWVDLQGQIKSVREDVGRHNALDKLIGSLIKAEVNPKAGFICITSRASFEMVQKTISFGVGILAAVSAPTALAVDLAREFNLALAGYVRDNKFVTYSFSERFL